MNESFKEFYNNIKKSFINDQKGAINPLIIMSVFILILIFYIWLQLYIPLANDYIFPILVNVPMGTLIQIIIEYIPLSIAILVFVYAIAKSGMVAQPSQIN